MRDQIAKGDLLLAGLERILVRRHGLRRGHHVRGMAVRLDGKAFRDGIFLLRRERPGDEQRSGERDRNSRHHETPSLKMIRAKGASRTMQFTTAGSRASCV